jgi:ankyrin repeat protein
MILRNLIVAGAGLNERGPRQQSALHMAAEREDGAVLTSILLDAGADWSALDDCGNSALHTAARLCHVGVAQVLLTQSQVDAESRNMRGQNPLHLAAGSGRDTSASLLSLFLQCMSQYPINAPDIDGNSRITRLASFLVHATCSILFVFFSLLNSSSFIGLHERKRGLVQSSRSSRCMFGRYQ